MPRTAEVYAQDTNLADNSVIIQQLRSLLLQVLASAHTIADFPARV